MTQRNNKETMINHYIQGADISFWQDDPTTPQVVDFPLMKQGLDFVFIRAGQNLWKDNVFQVHWANAKAAGFPRGSYWFYDSRADPKRQAEKYISTLGGDLGELPLVADYEDSYGGAYGTPDHLYDFIERLKTLAPNKPIIIYTGYYYWLERFNIYKLSESAGKMAYFEQYDLWLAWYGEAPKIPPPWDKWTFWQYTSSGDGLSRGVESREIDLDYFNGDRITFVGYFDLSNQPNPSPPDNGGGESEIPMTTKYKFERAGTPGAALRAQPNANGTLKTYPSIPVAVLTAAGYIVDGHPAGGPEIITLTEPVKNPAGAVVGYVGDQWLHVTEIISGGDIYAVDGYTAVFHMGKLQGLLETIDDTPPPPTVEMKDFLPGGASLRYDSVNKKAVIEITVPDGTDMDILVNGREITWE